MAGTYKSLALFWNYKIEGYSTATLNQILDECDVISVTEQDEPELAIMLASSHYRGQPFIGYRNGNGFHNRTLPGDATYGNGQINLAQFTAALADNLGTPLKHNHFLRLRNSETASGKENLIEWRDNITAADSFYYILRNTYGGTAPVSGGNYPDNGFFDFSKADVFAFIQNVLETWDTTYYDGLFLDNLSTQFTALTGSPYTTVIGAGDSEELRQAYRDYLDRHQTFALSATGANLGETWRVVANIQRAASSDADLGYWKRMVVKDSGFTRRVDGVMIELGFISYLGLPETVTRWIRYGDALDYAARHGVQAWVVGTLSASTIASNPTGTEAGYGKYFLASALMFGGANTLTRISNSYGTAVNHLSIMDAFEDLGAPLSRYTTDGTTYTRNFDGGTLTVTPSTNSYTVTPTPGATGLPWVTHQASRSSQTGDTINLYIPARSVKRTGAGTITTTASGLPSGLTGTNVSSGTIRGVTITGTIASTASLRNDVTVQATESGAGGQIASDSWVWWVQPPNLATVSSTPVRFNVGGTEVAALSTDAITDAWLQDDGTSAQAARTSSGTDLYSSTASTLNYLSSVPPWVPQSVLQKWARSSTSITFSLASQPAGDYLLVLYFVNTGDAPGARRTTVAINGATQETFDYWQVCGQDSTPNQAFARTYAFTRSTTGTTTVSLTKAGSSQVQLNGVELFSYGEVSGGTPTITTPSTQVHTVGDTATLAISAAIGGSTGSLSYAATGLPLGREIDPVTGVISGAYQYNGTTIKYTPTVTVTQSPGGATASASYTEWVKPGTRLGGVNVGGAEITNTVGGVNYLFSQSNGTVDATLANGWQLTANSSTVSNSTTAVLGATVPPWYDTATLRYYRTKNTAPFPVTTIPNLITGKHILLLGFNVTSDTLNSRVMNVVINGSTVETFDMYTAGENTTNNAFIKAYEVDVTGGQMTVSVTKSSGANSRLFSIELYEAQQPPVLTTISPDTFTINEGANGTLVTVSATDANAADTLTFSLSGDPTSTWLDIVNNGDGTADLVYDTAEPGTYGVTVVVSDGVSTDSQSITITVRYKPEILRFALASDDSTVTTLNITEGDTPVVIRMYARDQDGTIASRQYGYGNTPPSGLDNFYTRTVTGDAYPDPDLLVTITPIAGDAGFYTFVPTVTDNHGLTAQAVLYINVEAAGFVGTYRPRHRSRSRRR